MEFEWNDNKDRTDIAKHGIGFARACEFSTPRPVGPALDWVDDRQDYGEDQTISLGRIEGVLVLVVVHTDRGGMTRIISAGAVKRAERRLHEEAIQEGTDD